MITDTNSIAVETLKHLSAQDWTNFGVNDVAYMKLVTHEGLPRYSIHAANGQPLAMMDTCEVAKAAIRQNELEPMSVH